MQYLLDRGNSLTDLAETIVTEADHAIVLGDVPQANDGRSGDDGISQFVVHDQQLVNADSSRVARVATTATPDALVEGVH